MAIEIVDLPMNSMVIFHSFLYVYQRVYRNIFNPPKNQWWTQQSKKSKNSIGCRPMGRSPITGAPHVCDATALGPHDVATTEPGAERLVLSVLKQAISDREYWSANSRWNQKSKYSTNLNRHFTIKNQWIYWLNEKGMTHGRILSSSSLMFNRTTSSKGWISN